MAVTRMAVYGKVGADFFGADYSGKTAQVPSVSSGKPTHRRYRIPRGPMILILGLLQYSWFQ